MGMNDIVIEVFLKMLLIYLIGCIGASFLWKVKTD